MSVDIATLAIVVDAKQVTEAAKALDTLAVSAKGAAGAADKLNDAFKTSGVGKLVDDLKRGAKALDDVSDSARGAISQFDKLADFSSREHKFFEDVAGDAKKASTAFSDVGEAMKSVGPKADAMSKSIDGFKGSLVDLFNSMISGQAPMEMLKEHGPKIAESFIQARAEGAGFRDIMGSIAESSGIAVDVLIPFAGVAAGVAAVVGGGLLVATHDLNAKFGDLTKGLGLTEEQLSRVKDKGVTMGDVVNGTLKYLGDTIWNLVGPAVKAISDWFFDSMTSVAKVVLDVIKVVDGSFLGAFEAIKAVWGMLPEVLGDLIITAANNVLAGLTQLINAASEKINGIIDLANSVAKKAHIDIEIPKIPKIDLGSIYNPNAGKAAEAGQIAGKAFAEGFAKVSAVIDQQLQKWMETIHQVGIERTKAEAGAAPPKSATASAGSQGGGKATRAQLAPAQLAASTPVDKPAEAVDKNKTQLEFLAQSGIGPDVTKVDAPEFLAKASIGPDVTKGDAPKLDIKPYTDSLQELVKLTQDSSKTMEEAFGNVGKAIIGLSTAFTTYAQTRQDLQTKLNALPDGDKDRPKIQAQMVQAEIKGFADMAGAAKGFFDEKSAGYKAMEVAEKAFRAIELAMSIKSIAQKAIETASTIASGTAQTGANVTAGASRMFAQLGIFAFPVVAAMIGVMVALGAKGLSAGGASPVIETAEDRQKAQGTGTVLGDASAKSDSIQHSLDIVANSGIKNLEYSSQMLLSLRSINTNIQAVAAGLARSLSLTGGAFDQSKLDLGVDSSGLFSGVPVLGTLGSLLFSSKVTRTLNDQGLQFDDQSVSDIVNGGVKGQTYQEVIEETKKSILGIAVSDKTKLITDTADLDASLGKQFTDIVKNLRTGVLDAAKTLGIDGAEATIDSLNVEIGKISLMGLKGSEIEDALNAVFSKVADQMADAVSPIVEKLQKVGEGAFETLTRLATEYAAVDDILGAMGKTFGMVGVESIEARDNLVQAFGSIDNFRSAVGTFVDDFFTDQEKLDIATKSLNDNLGYLAKTYGDQTITSLNTVDAFKAYIASLDDTTQSGAELEAALLSLVPTLKQVADATGDVDKAEQDRIAAYMQAQVADAEASLSAQGLWEPDNHRDQAAKSKAAYEAAQQAATDAAAAYKTLSDNVDASVPGLLKAGDVMGALAQRVSQTIANPNYDTHMWWMSDGSFNTEGFNNDMARQRANQAALLLPQVMAQSVSIAGAAQAMRDLVDVYNQQYAAENNHWLPAVQRQTGYDYTNAHVENGQVVGVVPTYQDIEGIVSSALLRGVSQYGLGGSPALPGLAAALDNVAFVGSSTTSFGGQSTYIGQDVNDYHYELDHLNTEYKQGSITLEQMNKAVGDLNDFVGPDFIKFANDATAQLQRANEAMRAVGEAGAAQISSVFSQITSQVASLDAASQAANDNLAQTTDAISRLTNEAKLLTDGASAAVNFGGSTANIGNAALIAAAADVASKVLTTADAAKAAAALAQSPAFANLDAVGIRNASLLLDGLKPDDAQSFANSFDRINNALIQGSVTQEQYTTLVQTALTTFEGLDDQVSKVMDAFKDLADQLKLDDTVTALSAPAKLAEAQRQYEATLTAARGGDSEALSALSGITNTYLKAAKDASSTLAQYSLTFGQVQRDLQSVPTVASVGGSGNDDIIAMLQQVLTAVQKGNSDSKAGGQAVALNTAQLVDLIDRIVNGNAPITTQAAA